MSIGPEGFAAHARLFHPLIEGDLPDEQGLLQVQGRLDRPLLGALVGVLARHTAAPDDCFFGLWEGFGDLHGSPCVGFLGGRFGRGRRPPPVPPAFPREVMDAPRLVLPNRAYLLFRGPLSDAGEWGVADAAPGWPRPINSPNLMWPADRAWFVATEIDLPWTGIAGSGELVADLLDTADIDVEAVEDPGQRLPYWKT